MISPADYCREEIWLDDINMGDPPRGTSLAEREIDRHYITREKHSGTPDWIILQLN